MEARSSRDWLHWPRPRDQARHRLFCFHYAGGGPAIFFPWLERLPEAIDLSAINLPGRGARLFEAPLAGVGPVIQALIPHLTPHLDRPFAFFGHSMGALLAFELARELRRRKGPSPVHLFLSAHRAPQLPPESEPIHTLDDQAFKEELRQLNGTPPSVLENDELMQLLLPALRADFATCETYTYEPAPPLDIPITAFGGTEDPDVSEEALSAWRLQTTRSFSLRRLPGDHFFIHQMSDQVIAEMSATLLR
jgi:medium-chain acyl-[acyl-carrier-protein] hydrolase